MIPMLRLLVLLALLSLLALGTLAHSQLNTVTVPMQTAKLTWTWALGTGGAVEFFTVRCTQPGGLPPIVGPKTAATARTQPVLDIVKVPGEYTCTVNAGNSYGESGPSPSVTFRAGDVPFPASTLSLTTGSPPAPLHEPENVP